MDNAKLKEQFDRDPAEVFLDVLRSAGGRITATKIMGDVIERGLPKPLVKKHWTAVQRDIIKYHPYIARPTTMSYEWRERPVDPDEALTLMLDLLMTSNKNKLKIRDELVQFIRSGLKAAREPEPQDDDARFRAAQKRQFRIDRLQAIADLAGEIEELAYNSGEPDLIVERVQARVQAHSLEQIGRSGDGARFDPSLHRAIGAEPRAGSPVTIVRPGYSWRNDKEDVLLQPAQVAAD